MHSVAKGSSRGKAYRLGATVGQSQLWAIESEKNANSNNSDGSPGTQGQKRHPHLIVITARRFGVCPTGIVATTFLVRVSIAETVLEVELLTKRRSPSG
jgi:hypothetical protein